MDKEQERTMNDGKIDKMATEVMNSNVSFPSEISQFPPFLGVTVTFFLLHKS